MLFIGQINVNGQVRTFTTKEAMEAFLTGLSKSEKFTELVRKEYESFITDPMSNVKALFGGKETFKLKKIEIDSINYDSFMKVYHKELERAFINFPYEYVGSFQETYHRMALSIAEGTFNKDSVPFKQTCKTLKIAHTYKAIKAFLKGEV